MCLHASYNLTLYNVAKGLAAFVRIGAYWRAHVYAGLVEHAAWTKGDMYLDKPMKNMPWYQQLLLDVFAVLAVITVGLAVMAVLVIKFWSKHMQRHAKVV